MCLRGPPDETQSLHYSLHHSGRGRVKEKGKKKRKGKKRKEKEVEEGKKKKRKEKRRKEKRRKEKRRKEKKRSVSTGTEQRIKIRKYTLLIL